MHRSVSVPSANAVIGQDSFTRTTANGWGFADLGGSYYTHGGTPTGVASVAGGVGQLALPTNAGRRMLLGGLSVLDVQATARFTGTEVPVDGRSDAGIVLRWNTSVSYENLVRLNTGGTVTLSIQAGAVLGTYTLPGATWSAGEEWSVRAQATGSNPTTIQMKAWESGSAEPTGWQLTRTDSTASLQQAAPVGGHGSQNRCRDNPGNDHVRRFHRH